MPLSVYEASTANNVQPTREKVKLLFSDPQDITSTWGKIHFNATSLQKIRSCKDPSFVVVCCMPLEDGAWSVYGQIFNEDKNPKKGDEKHKWKLIHTTTRDGEHFDKVETVFESEPGNWTPHLAMAYNPNAGEYLMLKLRADMSGFGYRAFFSPDGRNWKEHPKNPLFYDGDSMSLFWSLKINRFVCVSKTLQPVMKHIPDHGGRNPNLHNDNLRDRRVQMIRSSRDGRQWEPPDSMLDVWNRSGNKKSVPTELMTIPDDKDPPDMEFYRGIGFWYHDRSYMIVLNYAASPLKPDKHGPQLDTEWWFGRNGLRWKRSYRDVNALGDAFPGVPNITHNPMIIDGMILFHFPSQLVGMKQDRISYVGARANAEFSTISFQMPKSDLYLNAAIPSPDRAFAGEQAYIMAAVLDENGKVVPGFEPDKCVLRNADKIDLPLCWNNKSAGELAGHKISLRFYLRSANIYAVTSGK